MGICTVLKVPHAHNKPKHCLFREHAFQLASHQGLNKGYSGGLYI